MKHFFTVRNFDGLYWTGTGFHPMLDKGFKFQTYEEAMNIINVMAPGYYCIEKWFDNK